MVGMKRDQNNQTGAQVFDRETGPGSERRVGRGAPRLTTFWLWHNGWSPIALLEKQACPAVWTWTGGQQLPLREGEWPHGGRSKSRPQGPRKRRGLGRAIGAKWGVDVVIWRHCTDPRVHGRQRVGSAPPRPPGQIGCQDACGLAGIQPTWRGAGQAQ